MANKPNDDNNNFNVWFYGGSPNKGYNPIRAGAGKKEFPDGGDPAFRAVLAEMLRVHIAKSHDYGTGEDIYANYTAAEEIGVPAWKSCFVRALEKVQRLKGAFGGKVLKNENIQDSLIDLANQIVITKVLLDREDKPSGGCPGGGNCDCS